MLEQGSSTEKKLFGGRSETGGEQRLIILLFVMVVSAMFSHMAADTPFDQERVAKMIVILFFVFAFSSLMIFSVTIPRTWNNFLRCLRSVLASGVAGATLSVGFKLCWEFVRRSFGPLVSVLLFITLAILLVCVARWMYLRHRVRRDVQTFIDSAK